MDAREKLVMSHLNLVRFIANKFKNRGEPLDDLVQVGYLACSSYRPLRIRVAASSSPRSPRPPSWARLSGISVTRLERPCARRLQELSAKVNQATDTLTSKLQRSPTIAEIAEYLDASVDEVLEAMESSSAYSSVSLEAPSGMEDDDTPSVIDRYATEDEDLAFTDDRIIIEEALATFSPREREVIEMRFLQGMTQIEIAEKLGISQVQVTRLLRRTLKKIQDKIDPDVHGRLGPVGERNYEARYFARRACGPHHVFQHLDRHRCHHHRLRRAEPDRLAFERAALPLSRLPLGIRRLTHRQLA